VKRGLIAGAAVAVAATMLIALPVGAAEDSGRPLSAELSGAAEVPPADPDGSGTAFITLNQGQGRVCWELTWSNIGAPLAAHIHVAPAGVNGPIVVPLEPIAGGCISADSDLIKAIRQNSEGYYVNIHNEEFPGGAIRGQLG